MEMIQQLFMAAFVAFVFSILVDKLASVTINGDERQSKRADARSTKIKTKKKVRFAAHNQLAIVINNKLVRLDTIYVPKNKQILDTTSYDLNEVSLGAYWIGEESMIYKEGGLRMAPQELGFGGIQNQRQLPNERTMDKLQAGFSIDDQRDDGNDEIIPIDWLPLCLATNKKDTLHLKMCLV
ncbi:hypothetical protein L2E82_46883 [Cichorium intybus]|uniref:Uncharacterized protein n=1 Tax=Cichorium intybus TaxID=13427 RepID=A0ACB8YTU1_CICIN|nr:hypothetical protein L2E82_46883 [Cichorium intybus]